MKKTEIIILVVIVAIILYWYFFLKTDNNTQHTLQDILNRRNGVTPAGEFQLNISRTSFQNQTPIIGSRINQLT